MGAWIETKIERISIDSIGSHPSWVRGLKQSQQLIIRNGREVAPFVGAWIETSSTIRTWCLDLVAPFVGAWIETYSL